MREMIYFGITVLLYIGITIIIIKLGIAIAIRAIKEEFFENNYLQYYRDRTIKDQHREDWERWKQDREYEEYLQWKREKDAANKENKESGDA